ncbi:Semaphorin-7A [Saguinus oedipus]|uniref:Semaphorin-7A n=1 Tax=Saguinus oedipus TaxID=9490 RepID=A0ABQ9V3N7_SAGOE|nr:Semaphorin-7A [Saguinus oedipus]
MRGLVFNVMEIQPFRRAAAIQTISLDADRRKLYVSSQWEVSQVPLDLCEVYGGGCHGCLMSRDPYCGWDQDRCVSIYRAPWYVGQDPLSLGGGGRGSGGGVDGLEEVSVPGLSGGSLLSAGAALG